MLDLSNLPDKAYDRLKTIALIILPVGTFIATFLDIWGIPGATQVQQTFIALDVLAGALVSIAKQRYDARNGL